MWVFPSDSVGCRRKASAVSGASERAGGHQPAGEGPPAPPLATEVATMSSGPPGPGAKWSSLRGQFLSSSKGNYKLGGSTGNRRCGWEAQSGVEDGGRNSICSPRAKERERQSENSFPGNPPSQERPAWLKLWCQQENCLSSNFHSSEHPLALRGVPGGPAKWSLLGSQCWRACQRRTRGAPSCAADT